MRGDHQRDRHPLLPPRAPAIAGRLGCQQQHDSRDAWTAKRGLVPAQTGNGQGPKLKGLFPDGADAVHCWMYVAFWQRLL
jgi:hypothetical protein